VKKLTVSGRAVQSAITALRLTLQQLAAAAAAAAAATTAAAQRRPPSFHPCRLALTQCHGQITRKI